MPQLRPHHGDLYIAQLDPTVGGEIRKSSVIAHFTPDGCEILLEILDASEFLAAANRAMASRTRGKTVESGEP